MGELLSGLVASSVAAGAVIVLAALGELLAERTGVLNLGLEGIMAMGAVAGIIAVNQFVPNAYLGLLAAILVGLALGAIFAVATVTFKANQTLCGLALTFFGTGLAGWIGASYSGQPAQARFENIPIPLLSDIPLLDKALFNHNLLVYLAYLVLPVIASYLLFRTRHGLNMRAVGENPAAADATGIWVAGMRFLYVCVGAALAAAGGAYLTLAFTPAWTEGVTAGRGWIAIALVIFAGWRPFILVLGALLFGGVTSLGFVAQARGWGISPYLLSMLPYLSTVALILIPCLVRQSAQRRSGSAPAALGVPYFREEG
ncbi:MAG: ABC transporter permease [Chloroflexi bacterium]|nr:ABC transporter permease [Chloroflexota bacterium]